MSTNRPLHATWGKRPQLAMSKFGTMLADVPNWSTNAGMFCFWILAFCMLTAVSGIVVRITGVTNIPSTGYAILCVAIMMAFKFQIVQSLSSVGGLYFAFLFSYLGIAFISSLGDALFVNNLIYLYMYGATIVTIVASALVGRHIVLLGPDQTRKKMGWIYLICFISAGIVILSMFFSGFFQSIVKPENVKDKGRFMGFFVNPNEAGVFVVAGASLGFGYYTWGKNRLLTSLSFVAMFFAAIITFSRGALLSFVALVLGQVFILLLSRDHKSKSMIVVIIIIGALFIGTIFGGYASSVGNLDNKYVKRLESVGKILTGQKLDARETGHRFQLWEIALEKVKDAPLFGNGLGSMHRMKEAGLGAHNTYLLIVGEAGLLPFVIYLIWLAAFTWQAWKCKIAPIRSFVIGFIIVYCVGSMSGHGILKQRQQNVLLGLSIGMLAGASEMNRRQGRRNRLLAARRLALSSRPA